MSTIFGRALISGTALTLLMVAGCTSMNPSAAHGSSSAQDVSASVIEPPSTAPITQAAGSRTSAGTSATPATSSTIASPSVADSPTSTSPADTFSIQEASSQEDIDRAAVEAQWTRFWEVYENIIGLPIEERAGAVAAVAVDPIRTDLLSAAKRFDKEGLDYYGSVVEHPYWVTPIAGQRFAVMRDCQDQSHYGSKNVATGDKRSVGVERDSLQAGFIKGADDIWRVQQLQYLDNVPC